MSALNRNKITFAELLKKLEEMNLESSSGKTLTSSVLIESTDLLSLSLTVLSMTERLEKLKSEINYLQEQESNLLSLTLAILRKVEKQSKKPANVKC